MGQSSRRAGGIPLAGDLDQVARTDAASEGGVKLFVQGAYGGGLARCREEGGAPGFLCPEPERALQGGHDGIDEGAHIGGRQLGAPRDVGRAEGDKVGGGDAGAVEGGQQVGEGARVECGQHMQQVRHGRRSAVGAALRIGGATSSQRPGSQQARVAGGGARSAEWRAGGVGLCSAPAQRPRSVPGFRCSACDVTRALQRPNVRGALTQRRSGPASPALLLLAGLPSPWLPLTSAGWPRVRAP